MSELPQRQLFVVGFFRSGTSLLYSFLNLHPQVRLLYEADLLANSLVAVSSRYDLKWWKRLDFYNSCIRRHKLKAQPSWNQVRHSHEAANILYQQHAGPDRLYIGEKSPSYYNSLPLLARHYPQARFIVIWREPKAVISSIISAGKKDYFFRSRSLPLRSLVGFEQMQEDVLYLRSQGTPIFDFCCENLVENPESILRPICDFLEIPYEPEMLALERADYSMFPPGEHQDKARSGSVMQNADSPPPVQGELSGKAGRYLHRWKAKFQNQLTSRRYWPDASANPPGRLEVLIDKAYCKAHRFYSEQLIPVVYGVFPMVGLALYRRWRGPVLSIGSFQKSEVSRSSEPNSAPTKISVVTPSYKQLPWLKLCVASVADQKGVEVEHIIQDAQSGPELEEWVREHSKARLYVEADSGMYDAINRGFARATGDIVCWLNSDEQYLEGTLAKVARYFENHPEVDVLFGDALLVGNTGSLLSYRRTVPPNIGHVHLSHLNTLSCSTFVRRSVLERGFNLDTRWRAIADAVWIVDLLKMGIPMAVVEEPLAVFTITDKNLGQSSLALTETEIWQREMPTYMRLFRFGFILRHRLSKLFNGAYWPRSVTARLYTLSSTDERATRTVSFLGFKWPHKL